MTEEGADELVAAFARLHENQYEVAVHQRFGVAGVDALIRLLASTRELLKHVPFEMFTDGLRVLAPIDPELMIDADGGSVLHRLDEFGGKAMSKLTVVIVGTTTHKAWDDDALDVVCDGPYLTYRYVHGQVEEIVVDGTPWPVNDSPWACGMATPTFATLEEALAHYVRQNRVPEQCGHLQTMWRDGSRLGLVEKPEKLMRRSLLQALNYALGGDATVRPELNQSESRPVDIEVTWWGVKRSALIEIKWLGDSGPLNASAFSTSYTQARAVSGLKQLAEYLDLRDSTSSDVPVMGYLFVFDARRRNLSATQASITAEDGLYYALRDPEYPTNILGRADMGQPFRCFLAPSCA
ncbi:hypothetical protein GCM10023153_20870 [Ornithinibacter aureus]|uniref:Uncharacterized protein n=1 Tax=Ornithinibacter aureus TaxID=622664 RepID=A0ABP8JWP7_9MICO|nr:hypothetical protein C8E84_2363 [Ornithinibacter aureus]